MRLNKYIASAGVCSRRKADELIANGNVKVNGTVCREMGTQVEEGDMVSVNGKIIEADAAKVYVVVNKPLGYITSMDDDKNRPTVADLVSDIPERLFPVGRLDYNTTGLLIMTNDGDLAYALTHPKHEVSKTYIATVAGVVSNVRLAKLRKGVDIGGFVTSPAQVRVLKQNPRSAVVEISIHEGKNRQVRKSARCSPPSETKSSHWSASPSATSASAGSCRATTANSPAPRSSTSNPCKHGTAADAAGTVNAFRRSWKREPTSSDRRGGCDERFPQERRITANETNKENNKQRQTCLSGLGREFVWRYYSL